MRLTIRCLLAMMNTLECNLDELVNRLRQDPTFNWRQADAARKQQRDARKTLVAVYDQMMDTGYGD